MQTLPNFEKIKSSLLIEIFKTEALEPQNIAVGGWSPELVRWHKINEYSCDIERILKELFFAFTLIKSVPDETFLKEQGLGADDYILYHQGNILTLTHQLKDKLGQLCKNIFIKPFNEDNIKIHRLIKRDKIIAIPKLSEKLELWSDKSGSKIGKTIIKRALYHHQRNKNSSHADLQRYKALRSIRETPEGSTNFNMAKVSEEEVKSFERWRLYIEKDIEELLGIIVESVEEISAILYTHGGTARIEEMTDVFMAYQDMMDNLDIKNAGSIDKIQEDFLPLVELFKKDYPLIFKEGLESIYLIGSVARGEAVPLLSDLNILVILDNEEMAVSVQQGLEEMLNKIPLLKQLLDLQIVSKTDFLSEKGKKLRFICKTESVLLHGKDLVPSDEKFPKAGLELSYLLNSDFREFIQEVATKAERETLTQNDINFLTSKLARTYIRILFSGLMAESTTYERNIKSMVGELIERFPENKRQIMILDILSQRHLNKDLDTLKALLEQGVEKGGTYENSLTQIENFYAQLENRVKYK